MDGKKPRGSWVQFSLRSLLIAMLLVAAYAAGWSAAVARMKPLEQEARMQAERAMQAEMKAREQAAMAQAAVKQAQMAEKQAQVSAKHAMVSRDEAEQSRRRAEERAKEAEQRLQVEVANRNADAQSADVE